MIIRGKIGCKHDNMGHTCLHKGLLLGEYFFKYFFKSLQKILQKYLNFFLYYYVKVYVKDFKIYENFKTFEVYL
jgi:hypothetical protein